MTSARICSNEIYPELLTHRKVGPQPDGRFTRTRKSQENAQVKHAKDLVFEHSITPEQILRDSASLIKEA